MSIRKPSANTVGSRSIPAPSSPMVSSAHNPNKAEIPDRRKEANSTTVRPKGCFVGGVTDLSHLIPYQYSRYRWQNPHSPPNPISSDYSTLRLHCHRYYGTVNSNVLHRLDKS